MLMHRTRSWALWSTLLLLGFGAADAPAASSNYGNKQNADIQFNDITETAANPDPPLFVSGGLSSNIFLSPTASGWKLSFLVDGAFSAETTSAAGVLVDSRLQLKIVIPQATNPNGRIKSVTVTESGDWNLSNDGEAEVNTKFEWTVTQINFLANVLAIQQEEMTFTPAGNGANGSGHYDTDSGDPEDGQWSGTHMMDVAALSGDATAIEIFVVDNDLEAFSEDGGGNKIDKKNFMIEVEIVPEPGTAWLLSLALAGLGMRSRLRR